MVRTLTIGIAIWACAVGAAAQQTTPDLDALSRRLAALEAQSAALRDELTALRQELASLESVTPGRLEEAVELQAGQLSEQAQVKVEGTQRVPIRITGMLLFNAFRNSRHAGFMNDYPGTAQIATGRINAGANLRQSVIGLTFQTPEGLLGARYQGNVLFDLAGQGSNLPLAPHLLRLRSGYVEAQWKRRTILIGQDKVIFSSRDPNSLAQVTFAPLVAAGNLYGWRPQIRYEERIPLGASNELRARIGLVQSHEDWPSTIQTDVLPTLELRRPSAQGHFQFRHTLDERRRVEVGFGFQKSTTHAVGRSIPADVVSIDWLVNPIGRVEISGFAFSGKAISLSGRRMPFFTVVRQGTTVVRVIPIRSQGGWFQVALLPTPRLTVNLMAGLEDPRDADLVLVDLISRNTGKVVNLFYRIAPNIIVGAEAAQMRTRYKAGQFPHNNHYNCYLAFPF